MNEPKTIEEQLTETRPHIGGPEPEPEQLDFPEGSIGDAAMTAGQEIQAEAVKPLQVITEHPPAAPTYTPPNPLAMLASALEQGHDIDKLERLFDLAEKYEAKQAGMAFAAALSDFQGDCPDIVESKTATVTMQSGGSYTYGYADLDQIMRTIRPTLKACGLSVRYDAEVSDDGRRIRSTCYVMHRGGHTVETTFVVPLDEAMKVNDSQKMGSANSYACRYNVINALGLTTGEDNDAANLHGDRPGENIRSSEATPAPKKDDLDEFFPIGKWKGHRWAEVPLDYLEWAASNLTDKPDIVAACKDAITARLDSDDQQAQANAEDGEGVMSVGDVAREISGATDPKLLAEFWETVPEKARTATGKFYETRLAELQGNDQRGPDKPEDDRPF